MVRSEDAPTEPMEVPFPDVECSICRTETGESVTFRLFDTGGMRDHLRDVHSPGFTMSVHFPDPNDGQVPTFDFAD